MKENIDFWHQRFEQQAKWTENIRSYIIRNINIEPGCKILEVGSGTGAVLNHFSNDLNPEKYGIDLDWNNLQYNAKSEPVNRLILGNGLRLPIRANVFDITYCHYLLLWIKNPIQLLNEMKRATRSGGWICLFAEPDYLSRIISPEPLQFLGNIQNNSLIQQGVRLDTGRNLSNWLVEIGLTKIYWGILGSHQPALTLPKEGDVEWLTIKSDLEKLLDQNEIENLRNQYINSSKSGSKILFVPTFYAFGQKE